MFFILFLSLQQPKINLETNCIHTEVDGGDDDVPAMAGRYDTCGEYLFSCCRRHIVWAADTPGDPTSERKTAKNAESPGSSEVGHNAQTLIT